MTLTVSIESDLRVAGLVRGALDRAVGVNPRQIFVHVDQGVVRLAGMVGSLSERFGAKSAALEVDRVTTVIDSLRVPSALASSDAEIAQAVERVLQRSPDLAGVFIQAAIRNHVVTLTGAATRADQRKVVHLLAGSIPEIEFIDNRIVLSDGLLPEATATDARHAA